MIAVTSFALSLAITYVMPLVAYFSLPTRAWQLAGGALSGPDGRPLAPASCAGRGAHGVDRDGRDTAGLHLFHPGHALSG